MKSGKYILKNTQHDLKAENKPEFDYVSEMHEFLINGPYEVTVEFLKYNLHPDREICHASVNITHPYYYEGIYYEDGFIGYKIEHNDKAFYIPNHHEFKKIREYLYIAYKTTGVYPDLKKMMYIATQL